ncbi:MAG: Lrp/AsnC ligand binding domain-containing protein [Candidatus Bathyarchaeia archaeon]
MRAFVLINVDTGMDLDELERAVKKAKGARRVYSVTGPYDMIAEIEASDMATMGKIVSDIRLVDGVLGTLTLVTTKG